MAMNTRFAMVVPGIGNGRGDELAGGTERIVEEWEACLSTFRSGAELQVINTLAFERELMLSEPMARVLETCKRYNRLTAGLFDPAAGRGGGMWTDVILDPDRHTIRFANSGIKLDMGGIGKGIALEGVVAWLKSEDVNDAFLSFGESSLAGMGKHPHGEGWLVGAEEGFLLRDEFLSVSGLQDLHTSGEDVSGEDTSGAHIYHPLKGELINSARRVLVKCNSPVEAEVLSTCGYMADEKEFEQLKTVFPSAEWIII
ncbi:MAG: hypothetical protein GY790_12635 [Bacteroidetes bacterium]|nr:hypothetical protein [Bacteroidota bacterium]